LNALGGATTQWESFDRMVVFQRPGTEALEA